MSDNKYNLQFEKLCSLLQLGDLVSAPEAMMGGLLHRMYSVETDKGKYAIKALNPQIMLRPTARQRYIESERIAEIAANKISALPAKKYNGTFIHELDNQFYLVFDWVEGKSLKPDKINILHCEKIGSILADIHLTDFSELNSSYNPSVNAQLTDWNYYLQKGKENGSAWADLLFENVDKLYDWNEQGNKSANLLASDVVISHRDLDPKNVLWNKSNPIIIDWEAAGYINPMQELTETAVYWSENEAGSIEKERFLAFVKGYKDRFGKLQANWRMALEAGFLGKLGWLEYNLKRSLMIECTDKAEHQLGTNQAIETIGAIRRYSDIITEVEEWLNEI